MNRSNPIVLVLSYGKTEPITIINHIELNQDQQPSSYSLEVDDEIFNACLKKIKTKYYENTIAFLPFTNDISKVPKDILQATEALIIFFDGQDKTFLDKLPQLCSIAKNNKIELGMLVTDKMSEEKCDGLTYEDVKSICYESFDLIELYDDAVTENAETSHASGYEEISEALRNHLWSNAIASEIATDATGNLVGLEDADDELKSFEALLNHIQSFKQNSDNLDRKVVLDQAEVLAELFDDLLKDD